MTAVGADFLFFSPFFWTFNPEFSKFFLSGHGWERLRVVQMEKILIQGTTFLSSDVYISQP